MDVVTRALDERSIALRESIVDALVGGRRGHVGASFSLVEILRVLYDDVMRYRPHEPHWDDRDRFILSKGHGCLALYALLADKGFFPAAELALQCTPGALLGGHPETRIPGVEASTGALGHGLSIGVGIALATRMAKRSSRVFVVTGDGELDEGSVWEAALSAAKHKLDGLTLIVDYNKLQSYGRVSDVLPLEPLGEKFAAFGFSVVEVDGHDVAALRAVLGDLPRESGKPTAVIAHTVKGKGVPVAEHNPLWHHKASFDAASGAELRAALREISHA
ncbi:MAG: transketolase [Candidatus Velthaea sp.]